VARIGVCEDDTALRSVLVRALRSMDHEPVATATAHEALQVFVAQPADVLILDIGLPDSDGRDLCLALRAAGVTSPVLFLTARDGLHDKIAGFESGGDDYLTKPFQVDELRVRLAALVRRAPAAAAADGRPVLDPTRHALVHDGVAIDLTPTEFRLLARLMSAPGEAVRRHALTAAAWPSGAIVHDNTLDSYLRRLRSKLADVEGARITTVRGVGYRWE
jgi:two-component system OmpR family response regulator